ncbi:MAG: TetR/AcrR family transcriptional regulator [Lachnospiraceae bacterium]|nr:TetR/AcrR family transcriptional regulator [Lachnospiraceae bacterium]
MKSKQDILEATLELACEKGLGSISMSQIADKVGLKKSSLYSHFKSKAEIIESMYEYFREKAKEEQGVGSTDYNALLSGHSPKEILTGVVNSYKAINKKPELDKFYRLIMSERVYNPMAASVMVEENNRMIAATKMLFDVMNEKEIMHFENTDSAALVFAMGVHSVMDFEHDSDNAERHDADGAMEKFIDEFCHAYVIESRK